MVQSLLTKLHRTLEMLLINLYYQFHLVRIVFGYSNYPVGLFSVQELPNLSFTSKYKIWVSPAVIFLPSSFPSSVLSYSLVCGHGLLFCSLAFHSNTLRILSPPRPYVVPPFPGVHLLSSQQTKNGVIRISISHIPL